MVVDATLLKKHFEFILFPFLGSFLKTINQRYCGKFLSQREKARVKKLNIRLGI